MNRNIDTIFFDVGATLRYVVEDPEFAAAAEKELMELVGAEEPHDVFFEKLEKNELEEIRNFSFELKPKPTSEEDLLLKEFLDGLNNYLTMEMLNFHSPKEIEDLRHLYKIRENLWNEVEKRWKK